MSRRRDGYTVSLEYIDQTCPIVDELLTQAKDILNTKEYLNDDQKSDINRLMSNLVSFIKRDVTEKFRSALNEACCDLTDKEIEVSKLEDTIEEHESTIENLIEKVDDLESELNEN